ncbi:hypothetical protein ISS08_01055 [Candidatus Pacearchaeota archaeon]|nr:hypothetical protein [Candidatus Pacearchaeota archaeon]
MTEKAIIFDSGTLISFSMNGMLDLIVKLKSIFKGKFLIPEEVKMEIIDKPLKIKRFELEALKLKQLLEEGILELASKNSVNSKELRRKTQEYLDIANNVYSGQKGGIHLIEIGEASCLALSNILSEKGIKNVIAIDERTTRSIVEGPQSLKKFLEQKLHTKLTFNEEKQKIFQNIKFIRSTELAYVAYKKGLVNLKNGQVLDALLYAMKFKGCAISSDEIEAIKRIG